MPEAFDVVIAGASLAGSAAALHLARAGHSVCLIDRRVLPRDKSCGEGLSSLGVSALHRLGFAAELAAGPHATFGGYRLTRRGKQLGQIVHEGSPSAIGIARSRLDTLLHAALGREPLVTVRMGEPVSMVRFSDREIRASIGSDEALARFLLVADGMNSPLARWIPHRSFSRSAERHGVTHRFEGTWSTVPSRVEISIENEGERYVTPLGPGSVNISYVGTRRFVRAASSLDSDACLGNCSFTPEKRLPTVGASPFGSQRRDSIEDRVLFLGDAAETLDPIGGMGMTHALLSAELAAGLVCAAFERESNGTGLALRFATERRRDASLLRGFTGGTLFALRGLARAPSAAVLMRLGAGELFAGRLGERGPSNWAEAGAGGILRVLGKTFAIGRGTVHRPLPARRDSD